MSLSDKLYKMREEERHCDFVIKVGPVRIPAHRSVLTAMSEYFDKMLTHDTIENSSGKVDMKDVDVDCVKICVDFMYGKERDCPEDKFEDLMNAASLMQLPDLAEKVEIEIGLNLDEINFFVAKRIADKFSCKNLEHNCKEFAKKYLGLISTQDEFCDLDKDYLSEILASPKVTLRENEKLDAALKWAGHDEKNKNALLHLLKLINLQHVSVMKRHELMDYDPLIKDNLTCVRMLSSSIIKTVRSHYDIKKEKVIVIHNENSKHLVQFKPRSQSWGQMHEILIAMDEICFSMRVLGDYIYVFMKNKKVFRLRYTDEVATWEQMADMLEDHGWVPSVTLVGRFFYAIGGYARLCTKSIERFNPETDSWLRLQDGPYSISDSALLEIRGSVYSFGGFIQGTGYTNIVQRFDPITSEWKEMRPMKEAYQSMAAVKYAGKAYVMGATTNEDTPEIVVACGCYDPQRDQWTTLKSVITKGSVFTLHVVDSCIYVVGLYATVEKYDIGKDEWSSTPIPNKRNMSLCESVVIELDQEDHGASTKTP